MGETKTSDFPLRWENPADAQLTWELDPMHSPGVSTPLGFDLYTEPFVRGFGMLRACQQNYYVFYRRLAMGGAGNNAPVIDPASVIAGGRLWRDVIMPEIAGYDEHYRLSDFDAMPSEELAAEIDRLAELRVRCGQLHTMCTGPWWMGMTHLIDTCTELTGGDDLAAVRLVQGYGNKSVEAGEALWRLSRLAASISVVRGRLLAADADSGENQLKALESEPAAKAFLEAFSAFLDEFGWRSGLFEFAAPTWAEDPAVPLSQLRAYLAMDDYDPAREQQRLAGERDVALQEALAPLAPEGRARLQAAVDAAAEVASILEDHNYYLDQRVGVLPRRLVLAAGRRLVSHGVLADPTDVFYLRHSEVREALVRPQDLQRLVAERKEEMAQWAKVKPPAHVGAPPPETAASDAVTNRFWGGPSLRSDRPDELRGSAASGGIARGPARVLASLLEASRLKPGDVLVTRTTMPPWTPLFAVASAVVTETGGILSHAAVTAREYGLPAVLNVQQATHLIKDGQVLEVDGSKGIVRILN